MQILLLGELDARNGLFLQRFEPAARKQRLGQAARYVPERIVAVEEIREFQRRQSGAADEGQAREARLVGRGEIRIRRQQAEPCFPDVRAPRQQFRRQADGNGIGYDRQLAVQFHCPVRVACERQLQSCDGLGIGLLLLGDIRFLAFDLVAGQIEVQRVVEALPVAAGHDVVRLERVVEPAPGNLQQLFAFQHVENRARRGRGDVPLDGFEPRALGGQRQLRGLLFLAQFAPQVHVPARVERAAERLCRRRHAGGILGSTPRAVDGHVE